jgi:hypothetical protein
MIFDSLNNITSAVFGEQATITHGGTPSTVTGVFDSRHVEIDVGGGALVSAVVTTLAVVDSASGAVSRGDPITVRGGSYRVADLQPDAQGMTLLILEKL